MARRVHAPLFKWQSIAQVLALLVSGLQWVGGMLSVIIDLAHWHLVKLQEREHAVPCRLRYERTLKLLDNQCLIVVSIGETVGVVRPVIVWSNADGNTCW